MNFIFSVLGALIAATGFAVLFDVRKQHLLVGGTIGALGWAVFLLMQNYTTSGVLAVFISSTVVAFLSETISRVRKVPILITIVPGIIPLVPGIGAYETMLNFANGKYEQGIAVGIETLFFAGGIAAGIALVSTFYRYLQLGRKKIGNYSS